MATPQQINDLVGLYVAYFDRAPDPEGLQFWITQLDNGRPFNTIAQDFARSTEAREIYPFLSTPDLVLNSSQAFITSIYANLFGRTPDQEGLDFWTLAINSGAVAPGDMVEAIMLGAQDTLVNGQLIQDKTIVANKIECALMWTEAVVDIEGFQFDAEAYAASRAAIDGVGADQASVDAAKLVTQQYINEFATVSNFALQQATMEVVMMGDDSVSDVMVDTLMWGNPETGEGIPISEFFAPGGYFSLIASQAFAGVSEIDTDEDAFSIIDFSAVQSIDVVPTQTGDNTGQAGIDASGGIITFNYTDGSTDDIALGNRYYDLLTELMFVDAGDAGSDNNTRFFTQTAPAQLPVYVTADGGTTTVASEGVGEPIGYVDATLVTPGATTTMTVDVPLILTTTVNNGSTTFFGFTSADNDVIVAPTLDLLHAAYIDGGLGQNTLEVDAKGHFAQPKALLNIQTINVQNLPNIYTDNDNDSTYPDLSGTGATESILDLSRATALENLTITEGSYDYLEGGNSSAGDLAIIGVRNDATVTLSGGFNNDLYITTTGGYPADGFTVVLNNVLAHDGGANLFIADNASKLNLISEGGGSNLNAIYGYNDNRVTDLVISGNASLFIEDGLDSLMEDETPLTIDASANFGGVDLNIDGGEFITFIGSKGDDRFSVFAEDESGTSQGPDFGEDSAVVITNTAGDNWYDVDAKELTLTDADGDITVKAETDLSTITLGDGDNTVAVETAELSLTLGDGDNNVDIELNGPSAELVINDEFDKVANITAGDGENTIRVEVQTSTADVAEVNVTAGNGGNTVEVTQSSGSATQTAITINTGTGADTILAEGSEINITSGGGNDDITIVGTDNDYASDSVDIEADDSGVSVDGNDVISRAFNDGVLLNIDTGAGSATITLGVEGEDDGGFAINNVIAKEGSVITGTDITLNVNTYANLIAADVSGVTSVVLDDDAGNRTDSAQANDLYNGERAQLTVTMDQFLAIGADNMSVDGAIFNTQGFVKIIVTESTSLTDLGVDDLPRNIDLYLEIADGVTVTMTAEQLHTRIARDGVTLADDGNTDFANGNVVITGGGQNFDPFNSNDTVQTNINGQVYFGGSISTNDFSDGNGNYVNVTVQSVFGGYNRPADAQSEVVFTIDSDLTPTVGDIDSFHANIEIVGDNDITFDGVMEFGLQQGNSANLFTIDFSELVGTATGLTIGNFETVEAVYGNGVPGTEVFVQISGDGQDGGNGAIGFDDDNTADEADDRALISQGVSQYTVTVIDGPTAAGSTGNTATIRLCDKTEDLEVLAFRGNYNDTLVIEDAAWDLAFELQGGSTRKADGPTQYANVGILDVEFEWDGGPAVVDIVHSVAGDTRPLYVEGMLFGNAASLDVTSEGPATIIETISTRVYDSVTFTSTGDIQIGVDVPVTGSFVNGAESAFFLVNDTGTPSIIDASGVDGTFTASLLAGGSGQANFTFTGAAGGNDLTLNNVDDDDADGVTIDGGATGVDLTIRFDNDLDESTLINVTSVTLEDRSSLQITMDQADAIGAENFSVLDGVTDASLMLVGLSDQVFAVANYPDELDVSITLADDPVVTLNPLTDLTDITALVVPEGTVLNLTAEQFQQLDGAGTITGEGGTTNFTVNITDWTQASTDDGIDLSGVTADTFTITMAEDIALGDSDDLGTADVVMSDGFTITVPEITQIDGINFSGGVDTTINITDDTFNGAGGAGVEGIDASGFDVDLVRITNVLAADRNVDALLDGIPERATKEIYNTLNFVDGVTQNVVLFEGTTIPGGVGFIPLAAEIELRIFNLYMEGGTEIDGTLRLFQSDAENGLLQNDLQEVNIFSTNPTAVNALSGDTGNVINGDINAFPGGGNPTFDENDLLNVNISGDADFTLTGDLRFNSVVGLGLGANDNEDATATLTVNSTANTVIGEIDTSDADVIAVVITNEGTGNLTVGINSANIDADDAITFTGSATGYDKISVQGNVDFSDDTLTDVDELEFDNGSTTVGGASTVEITVTQAQFDAIGVAGFTTVEDNDLDNNNSILNLVEFGASPFDATALDADINLGSITMMAGDITLDPTTDLTGVSEIFVPEGGSITLTAAQFQQLDGNGTITSLNGFDLDTANAGPITINITDLTQADIDGGSFILTDVDSGTDGAATDPVFGAVNLSLAESVELSADDDLTTGNAGEVEVALADGQDLGLENSDQADGLNVTGTGTTDVFFRFDMLEAGDADGVLDMSAYDVTNVHALNFFVGGTNIEELLNQLSEDVTLVIYQDPEELGILSQVNRVVIINEGVTVQGGLAFNDLDEGTEVVALNLTLSGGSTLDGDIQLDTVVPATDTTAANFQLLTINSIGDGTTENLVSGGTTNIITGNIIATPTAPGPVAPDGNGVATENNLLNVVINADQALEIEGSIEFNHQDDNDDTTDPQAATLTVNGTADVTIADLDTGDADVTALNVTNAGTGDLTVGITSTSTVDPEDVITLTGSATGTDTIIVTGGRDFTGDIIGADWDVVQLNNGTTENLAVSVTVTQAQFDSITAAGFTTTSGEDDPADNNATLNLTELGSDPFDATSLDADINMGTVTLAAGNITLDPTTNLTGVDSITVLEGSTLTMTAAQFQQLEGAGTIIGVDSDGNPSTDFVVNITDLTQADVDIDLNDDGDADDAGETLNLSGIAVDELNLALVEDIVLDQAANLADAQVTMPDGTTLTLVNSGQADGLDVTGGADTTVVFLFSEAVFQNINVLPGQPQIDASGYDITTLKALATFIGGYNAEFVIDDLPSAVVLQLFADAEELGLLNGTNRIIFVEEDVVVPGASGIGDDDSIILNDYDTGDELLNLLLTLDGNVEIQGDIALPTRVDKDTGNVQRFFETLTIVSQGDELNVIDGDIDTFPRDFIFLGAGAGPNTAQNNLLDIVIVADQDLTIGTTGDNGTIRFNGVNDPLVGDTGDIANLTITGTGNVQIKSLNAQEDLPDTGGAGTAATPQAESITDLNVTNNSTGTLTIAGGDNGGNDGDDAIVLSDTVTTLTFSGTGDIVLDTDDDNGENGVNGAGLENLDASGHSGDLTLSVIEDVSSEDFTMTAGTGVTTATLGDATGGALDLDSTGTNSSDDTDDTAGWTFDFSNAATGSVLTVANIEITPAVGSGDTDQSSLSFDMGADAVLKIEQDLDLTNTDFSFTGTQAIELLDGQTLTLTAAQANGLTIIRCDDGDDGTDAGVVNIIDLGTDPVDLSGIDAAIAGSVRIDRDVIPEAGTALDPTVLEDDVTLDAATDLGAFTVELLVLGNGNLNLAGQTIRFTTEDQAAREIDVVFDPTEPGTVDPAADGDNTNSTNVAFLFETIAGQVDTSQYDEELGRVWVSAALVDSVGGDIEDIFTTLPNSIVRVDFNTVADLDILLASAPIDRVIELTSFTTIVGITENDDDIGPEEHIRNLDIRMGGEVTVGDIIIGDVIAAADTDPLTPEFETLTFDSRRALSDEHVLATEDFVNDNDGTPETGESVQPDAVNTVGDIEVGGTNLGIDLIDVVINTFNDSDPLVGVPGTPGPSNNTDGNAGADFVFGTLTFDSEGDDTATAADEGEGLLTVTGENDVTGKAIDASDAEITSVAMLTAGHTGTLTFTGGSPAFFGGAGTEELLISNLQQTEGVVNFGGTITFDDTATTDVDEFSIDFTEAAPGVPYAGIAGEELSLIQTDDHGGTVNLGVIAQIDGTGRVTDDSGLVLSALDADGFRIDNADGANGVGAVYACFGDANVNGTVVTPTLTATGEVYIDGGSTGPQTVFLEIKNVNVEAGGKIALIGTEVTITGDIDLTAIAVEDLVIINSVLMVAEGGTLTLTVEQVTGLDLLNVDITGSGTVVVTGTSDDTDTFTGDPTMPGTNADFSNLQTATVDLSAVTLADDDANDYVDITATGAIGDDGLVTTKTIIGTAENDLVTTATGDTDDTTLDLILDLGGDDGALGDPLNVIPADPITGLPLLPNPDATMFLGDVILNAVSGGDASNIQVVAGEGFDAAISVETLTSVQVAAGAEFGGIVEAGVDFVATADTTNDGVATLAILPLFGAGDTMVDVSVAGGANGWNLLGSGLGAPAADTLIGSEQDDVINSGDISQSTAAEADELTGNGGADVFVFSNESSTPTDPAVSDPEVVVPVDQEIITLTADDVDDGDEGLVATIAINGVSAAYAVDLSGVNVTDVTAVTAATATQLTAIPGITAVVALGAVSITGDNGNSVAVLGVAPTGTVGTLAGAASNGTDTAEQSTMTIAAPVVLGEVYSALVVLADGTTIGAEFEVGQGGSAVTVAAVTAGLVNELNNSITSVGGTTITVTDSGGGVITFNDANADNGGFTLTSGVEAAVIGTGASAFGAALSVAGALATADVITDFMTGEDQIDLNAFAGDGTATNYMEAAAATDFATALTNATAAIDDTVSYYLTSSTADSTGLLFFDADGNGSIDGVVNLVGVDDTNFAFGDIIA